MQPSHFNRGVLIVALLLTLGVSDIHARKQDPRQEETDIYVVDSEIYEQVLDLVFPREVLKGPSQYAFVLRYIPPFIDAESQITIVNEGGRIEVVEYTSVDGNIYAKLNGIFQRTNREDAVEMAKQIRVKKRVVSLSPAEVTTLRQSFYDRLYQSASYERKQVSENVGEVMVLNDATRYLLWYRGTEESHYYLEGHNINVISHPADEHPLIDWMRGIRRTIKKSPTAYSHKHYKVSRSGVASRL